MKSAIQGKGTFGVTVCTRLTAHKVIDIPVTMTETAADWFIGGIYISKKMTHFMATSKPKLRQA